MRQLDFKFHHKYVLRFLLLQKLGYKYIHPYNIPNLSKIKMYFSVKDLVDFDHIKGSNYYFFFKYFFGKKASFVNYTSSFSLNVLYHSFEIQLIFRKHDIYLCFDFLFNDILPFCNNQYAFFNARQKHYVSYTIYDMNIFLERKTHVGFFNLKDNLSFKFYSTKSAKEKTFLF